MRLKSTTVQIVVLVIAASALAMIANAFGTRERRLKLIAHYPNARVVPPRVVTPVLPTPMPVVPTATTTTTIAPETATIEPVPAPIAPTTTTAAPAVTTTTSPAITKPSPTPIPAPPTPSPAPDTLARFAAHPDKPYVEIGGDDVAALHKGGVLFLDARRSSVYAEGHIAGARPFSVWESDVDDKVNALFNERSDPRDQNLPIVIYCSGGACEDSHMLAQKLWGVQFNNVYVYKDGYPDWQKRGGATRSGANP